MAHRRTLVLVLAGLAMPAPAAADRFIATSGVPHFDIADVSGLPGWDRGDGNGTSPAWESAIDTVLGTMAAQPGVDATLMTGDLVSGYWGRDATGAGIFGPVRTPAQRRAAVTRAARTYYGEIRRDWAAHPDLGPVLPAAGDHELANMPHAGRRPAGGIEDQVFDTSVAAWADAFGRPPTYAAQLPGRQDVVLATLSPIRRTRSGLVAAIGPRQLAWLDTVFAGREGWKVIQVEIPPSPVPRRVHSSGTVLHDGRALWAKARALGVHVIFTAEAHALNAAQEPGHEGLPGPVLVTNGGGMYGAGSAHFVVTDVDAATMTLTARTVPCRRGGAGRLWQTTLRRPRDRLTCAAEAPEVGRLTLTRGGVVLEDDGALALPPRAGLPVLGPFPRSPATVPQVRHRAAAPCPHPHAPGGCGPPRGGPRGSPR